MPQSLLALLPSFHRLALFTETNYVGKKNVVYNDKGWMGFMTQGLDRKEKRETRQSALKIDVAVISMDEQRELGELESMFPHSSVRVQRGVDFRDTDVLNLYRSGMIGTSAYKTIQEGRKWHWEIGSKGAVGLAHANRLALGAGTRPLLLLEDDYTIIDHSKFVREIENLHANMDQIDIAVFGAIIYHGSVNDLKSVSFTPTGWYHLHGNMFWNLHCVFYSPSGREKVKRLLSRERLEMQMDSLYSIWSETDDLKIILQLGPSTSTQRKHTSSIQTSECALCDVTPQSHCVASLTTTPLIVSVSVLGMLGIVLVLGLSVMVYANKTRKGK